MALRGAGLRAGFKMAAEAEHMQKTRGIERDKLQQQADEARATQIQNTLKDLRTKRNTIIEEAVAAVGNAESPEQAREIAQGFRPLVQGTAMLESNLVGNTFAVLEGAGQEPPEGAPNPQDIAARAMDRFDAVVLSTLNAQQQREQTAKTTETEAEAKARGTAAGTPREPASVTGQFGVIDTETGERFTVMRTEDGLFMQAFDDDGRAIRVPVDSSRIRPISTQEAGTSEEIGLSSTEQRQLNDAEVGTRTFIASVGDALQLLKENPDINTFVGKIAGVVNDLQAEVTALARAAGIEFQEGILDPENHSDTFQVLGIENRRMQSLITSVAFQAAAASGQTGRAVSDRDIQRFIKEIGAQTGDPEAFARVLIDVAERADRNFRINFRTRTGEPFTGGLGVSELRGGREGAAQKGAAVQESVLPEGVADGSVPRGETDEGFPVYEQPDGTIVVVE